jgi:surface protein
MFRNCSSLKNLDLSNFDLLNISDISYMFFGCKLLENLNIINFSSINNPDMSWMFENINENCKVICNDKEIKNLINS